jgi:ribosomal protein L37AE/L43A
MSSDALVDLQAQLTEAAEAEMLRCVHPDVLSDAAVVVFTHHAISAAWPLIESALAAERQAGRLQGREEAAQVISEVIAMATKFGDPNDTYAAGCIAGLRTAQQNVAVEAGWGVPVEAAQEADRCPNCASAQVNVDDGDWTCEGCGAHGDYRSTFPSPEPEQETK